MIGRRTLLALSLIAGATESARSQVDGFVFLVGYGVLSVGALHSLLTLGNPPNVVVGTRLKVRLRGFADWSEPVSVLRVDADSVFVQGTSLDRHFARSEIDSVSIQASHGRWAEGWAIGLLAGASGGALLAYTAASRDPTSDDSLTPDEAAVVGGIILGVGGSIVGAGIGLLAPSRWVTIGGLPRDSRLSIVPTIRRPGFVAHLRF